jgi:hypothetical protein
MAFTRRVAAAAAGVLALAALTVALAAPAEAVPPANDDIADAEALPATGDVESTTVDATLEDGEIEAANPWCPVADPSVWFTYTATSNDVLRLTTRSTATGPVALDTELSVYTSSNPSAPTIASLSQVRCNDDMGLSYKSQVSIRLAAGTTYFVQVSTWGNEDGGIPEEAPFVLRLETSPGPTNDDIADAETLVPDVLTSTTTEFSTVEPGEPEETPCTYAYDSVWYRWTAPADVRADIELTDSPTAIPALNVFSSPTPDFSDLTHVACDSIAWEFESDVSFTATAGTTYWVQLSDFGIQAHQSKRGSRTVDQPRPGPKQLILRTAPAPVNDDLANATTISSPSSTIHVDTTFTTLEPGEPSTAAEGCAATRARTQWFRYTPTASGELQVRNSNTADPGEEPVVLVYSGPATSPTYSALTFAGCPGAGFPTQFHTSVTAGVTYYIQAGTFREKGAYDLELISGTTTSLAASSPAPNRVDLTASVAAVSGTPAGTVTFYDVTDGSALEVDSTPVVGGQATLTVTQVPVGNRLYRAIFVPTGTGYNDSTSSDQPVTVAAPSVPRAESTTSIRAPAKVRRGKAPTITISVLRGTAPATGQITVLLKKKVLGTFTLVGCGLSRCPLKVKLPKLTKRAKITVTYAGNATTLASSAKATIKIKKK